VTPYEQLLARLLPARRFGVVLGLERMHAIFERLGHPERRLGRVIHVGGTNGKGSTVAMIAHLLRVLDAKVATYTSPHLSCLRERICFDDPAIVSPLAPISEQSLVSAAERVRDVGGDELTFFEQLTAIACVAIADRGVDFTILEVGLGGRLDATNAIDADVAVVTGVAMDHAAILGDTLEKIALEKAGIFKRGQQVVIGASGQQGAVDVLVETATRVGGNIRVVTDAAIEEARRHLRPSLATYQASNAAAAVEAADALQLIPEFRHGWYEFLEIMHDLPGRLETVQGTDPEIIIDGAHNPHAAAALADELQMRSIRPTVVVSVSSDKDVPGIAAALGKVASHVIATRYQQERALPPEQLAATFEDITVETAPDLRSALKRAASLGAPIVVTGSLFLVGEARVLLLGAPADPYVVTDPLPSAPRT
jgi:dihydrofolate synthase / folylpolyglutamate synthase